MSIMVMNTEIKGNEGVISQLNPHMELIVRIANEKAFHGDYAEALVLYDKALELNPKSAQVHHSKGTVYDMLGKYDEAIECYNSALEFDPSDAEIWYNKGMTLKKKGCDDDGAECIQTGISPV
ncbi:MAG TPA: tetratricopeptide repeat protein, partial [Methanospirillum sp.]|nr:tetratricopeptide repeat protein [Methanospirillum sp.]